MALSAEPPPLPALGIPQLKQYGIGEILPISFAAESAKRGPSLLRISRGSGCHSKRINRFQRDPFTVVRPWGGCYSEVTEGR
ncbi:hypothetical protein TNCT_614931 [Trichonephila clavata]|uniref:Uncharacterized protein n=1 Tax=Trichonephila clavata TaxID=2740835 RepID=A0A8X6GC49_TRICU|nr:hypothetical protein TNCT_614931 [Trichonephila clavata]